MMPFKENPAPEAQNRGSAQSRKRWVGQRPMNMIPCLWFLIPSGAVHSKNQRRRRATADQPNSGSVGWRNRNRYGLWVLSPKRGGTVVIPNPHDAILYDAA